MRALPVLLALLAAGCLGQPVEPTSVGALRGLDDVVVHLADGTVVDASRLAEPLVAALRAVGAPAIEPTLGVDAEGRLFYAAQAGRGPAIGSVPIVLRSEDAGLTWTDVSPRLGPLVLPPETNDPFLYVDPDTGRVFQFAMAPILVCSVLSWSDDAGETWTTNPRGCGNTPPWDHQALVAAPPRGTPTVGYPNVLVQCVNNLAASACSRSLDGGLTWTPGAPAYTGPCSGLHGHPVAHPDGTIFLPKMSCGVVESIRTEDGGLTWETVVVAEGGHPWPDPAMAVDDAGNVYAAWPDEAGILHVSVSHDVGRTWSTPLVASPPGLTTHIPALAAGAAGRVVVAYPGTPDLPEGYDSKEKIQEQARWHGYLTLVSGLDGPEPLFATVRVNAADDPLVRGMCGPARCPGMIDFIDVVVGPDGRPYASFVDACTEACSTDPEGESGAREGLLATLTGGPRLRDA